MAATKRYRNYACMVYPDSAPENWVDILKDSHIPIFISPLHEKDIDPLGQPKKPHYHVMVMYDGVQTLDQVREFLNGIAANNFVEIVKSLRGYARYLIHKDNPEKVQYDAEQVQSLSGADYNATIGLSIDKYHAIREMQYWCQENNITSFYKLCDYALENRMDWYRILCDIGVFMREYLKSRRDIYTNKP